MLTSKEELADHLQGIVERHGLSESGAMALRALALAVQYGDARFLCCLTALARSQLEIIEEQKLSAQHTEYLLQNNSS